MGARVTIDIIENASQTLVSGICLLFALARFYRQRDEAWTCLCAFFGCTFFAISYWFGHLVAFGTTPIYFYVSEMGWAASYLLMLVLMATLDEQRAPEPPVPAAWLSVLFVIPQFALYLTRGDIIFNVVDCSIMAAVGFYAIRGIVTPYREGLAGNRAFHTAVLVWMVLQFAVWTASCFWTGEHSVPYIVSDFLVTFSYLGILISAWRVPS